MVGVVVNLGDGIKFGRLKGEFFDFGDFGYLLDFGDLGGGFSYEREEEFCYTFLS